MKIKYIIVTVILFIVITPNVSASQCTKSDIIRVKGIANDVTIEKVPIANPNKNSAFDIKITGLTDEIYIKEETTGSVYTSSLNKDGVITLSKIKSGNYKFKFYYFHCGDELVRTEKFIVPKYNYYAKHSLCENIPSEEIQECYEWYQGEVTEELLTKKVNEYKNKQKENEPSKIVKLFEQVKTFILDYLLYIVGALVVIITVTIIVITNRKRGRLE